MSPFQSVIARLVLLTDASRAMLQLAGADGEYPIQAEAVRHAQRQIRHFGPASGALGAQDVAALERDHDIVVADEMTQANPPVRARMLAPILRDSRVVGAISLHHALAPRQWSTQDKQALRDAQTDIQSLLQQKDAQDPVASEDLRSAATQTILDRLRKRLDVQRCTFRQPVQDAFAFPVTFESRAEGLNSLLGDFTIVQTGQPVIVKLLAERAQVVQNDCSIASTDPLFHTMLAHYGGMRAQVVTPFIVDDELKGVLSIHELRDTRVWTHAEKALAAEAAALIGAIFETPR